MNRDRLNGLCCWGTPTGRCGDPETRPYPGGALCKVHAPWARAGRPQPATPAQRRTEQQ